MLELPFLPPEAFFSVSIRGLKAHQIPLGRNRKKFQLPDMMPFLGEERFADVSFFWNDQGIGLLCEVHIPFTDCVYPKFQEGDCLEVFIDTRDLKDVGILHRFCHHFLFLPVEVQGVRAIEMTRFRTEEGHPLADPLLLRTEVDFRKNGYKFSVYIPKEALFGYDPGNRLGFAYRLRRGKQSPQEFPCSFIDRFPSLWSTVMLEEV